MMHCSMWKYYYLCQTIDKLYTFISRQFDKDFRLLGLVRILQCPYVPHLYAYLARCARWKTIAQPKTNPSCVRYSIWGYLFLVWKRVGSVVRLD